MSVCLAWLLYQLRDLDVQLVVIHPAIRLQRYFHVQRVISMALACDFRGGLCLPQPSLFL